MGRPGATDMNDDERVLLMHAALDGEAWSNAKLDLPRHFTYWREPAVRTVLDRTGWHLESIDHVEGRTEPWLHVIARQ